MVRDHVPFPNGSRNRYQPGAHPPDRVGPTLLVCAAVTASLDPTLVYKSWPEIGPEERKAVARVLDRGVLSGAGAPEVAALEREWSELFGGPNALHTVTTTSGTAALTVAYAVLAARDTAGRREVVVPAYTFGATVTAVVSAGLTPRFVEVDPLTFNLDARDLQRIDPANVVAVAPVHLFGLPCDLDEIMAWARTHGIAVVEDAAQAHLATYRGRKVGTFGDFACFSLQSSKHLGSGEGGLLVTSDPGLATAARGMCSFGFAVGDEGVVRREAGRDGFTVFREHLSAGGMHRMQELPAAIARAKLPHLPAQIGKCQQLARLFFDEVGSPPGLLLPPQPPAEDRTHVFHKLRIGVDAEALAPGRNAGEVREALRARLHAHGLETTLWQVPIMPLHQAFRPYAADDGKDWVSSSSQAAVERSFILFDENRPLVAQDEVFAKAAASAFRRAFDEFSASCRGE
jgi:perosamine synthetase